MRKYLTTLLFTLVLAISGVAAENFSGTWTLDLKASDNTDSMMKRVGVSVLERKIGSALKLKATYHQSENVLNIDTKGPAFSRKETHHLDGRADPGKDQQLGHHTARTLWSKDGKQLITTNDFKTRDGKKAQLTVARHLTGGGKALVLTLTLKIEGEPDGPPVKRIWRKKV